MAAPSQAVDKRSRWRKDKGQDTKDSRGAQNMSLPLASRPGGAENKAAALAFRGLHGSRNDYSLISGATDDVYNTVLGGNAFYYEGLICNSDDPSMYEALARELRYEPCWMSGGTPLYRPTALGSEEALKQSPTYEKVVRWLAEYFCVEPVRSLVNHYRNGDDYTSFHSDQYYEGVDMTIGASFGDERLLVFEHRESKEQFSFPQRNGDIFAFTKTVNDMFTHGVPKERRRALSTSRSRASGRISVILWARKGRSEWKQLARTAPICLRQLSNVVNQDPNLENVNEDDTEEAEAKPPPKSTAEMPPEATAEPPPKATAEEVNDQKLGTLATPARQGGPVGRWRNQAR